MTWTGSTKDQGAAQLQGKGLQPGQVLPGEDWVVVLPTQKLLVTNQATPENFIHIGPSDQKLTNIFQNTGRQISDPWLVEVKLKWKNKKYASLNT